MRVFRKKSFVIGGKGESCDHSRAVAKEDFQEDFEHGGGRGKDQEVISLMLKLFEK